MSEVYLSSGFLRAPVEQGVGMAQQNVDATASAENPRCISTGSPGLNEILSGGLDADRLYLYEGRPGTEKTTQALQFLLEGARQGEKTLFASLSESEQELRVV